VHVCACIYVGLRISYATVNRALAIVTTLLILAALLPGCAGTGGRFEDQPADRTASSEEGTAVLDSLRFAEAQYREALSHYVCDEWDEAVPLLSRALSCLDATAPGDDELRRARASLRSRIAHFLETAPDVEGEPSPEFLERGSVLAGSDVAAWAEAESEDEVPGIELVRNERVDKWIEYFTGKGRKEMEKWLARSGRYRPMIEAELDAAGLPRELFYLAMIESGLNPNAYSRAHAAGMWQFISSRARMHGLRVDWWVDERRDPLKATKAACAYLRELHDMFGSWELALAGYNSGEGRVARAQKRRPSCEDYWCLDLPRETENFVPKFMAAAMICSAPEEWGFSVGDADPPLVHESIDVVDATDLTFIAEAVGVTEREIKDLNPALRRWCTPPADGPATVNLPPGTGKRCLAALASVPESERVTWHRHRISRGENLTLIARAYGTSVRAILEVNSIRNPNRIRAGDHLIIPVGPGLEGARYADGGVVHHKVSRGDTISSIARRYGKRTSDVLRWNGLGWDSRIYPGDVIAIHNM